MNNGDQMSNGDDERVGAAPEGDAEASKQQAVVSSEPLEEPEQPQITLDRYLSRRRPSARMGWPQMFSMIAMLVALLMIVFYKDQCGSMVGGFMNTVAPGGQAPGEQPASAPAPAVRYRLSQ